MRKLSAKATRELRKRLAELEAGRAALDALIASIKAVLDGDGAT